MDLYKRGDLHSVYTVDRRRNRSERSSRRLLRRRSPRVYTTGNRSPRRSPVGCSITHVYIVYTRGDRRIDRRRDSRLVYTLQATGGTTIAPTVAATIAPCIRIIIGPTRRCACCVDHKSDDISRFIHSYIRTCILFCSNKTLSIAENTWASWMARSTGH